MKRIVSLLLVCALLLSGCTQQGLVAETLPLSEPSLQVTDNNPVDSGIVSTEQVGDDGDKETVNPDPQQGYQPPLPDFTGLDDPALCRYVQDTIYSELVKELDSSDYFIENVSASYVSIEYLEEVAFKAIPHKASKKVRDMI